ncbi:DUF2683 family protein [Candidatus Woesearchaeota archaeon]|nr:DUF2683 family protein [Candidatus Woesearchaeota archaeon]
MVQALVTLDEETNKVLNVVKAKNGLKDKAEAIEFVVHKFVEFEEPELRPAFVEKMKRIEKQPAVRIKDFRKRYGLN